MSGMRRGGAGQAGGGVVWAEAWAMALLGPLPPRRRMQPLAVGLGSEASMAGEEVQTRACVVIWRQVPRTCGAHGCGLCAARCVA